MKRRFIDRIMGSSKRNLYSISFLIMVISVIWSTAAVEAVIAPASYVIYHDGTTIYAQNGQTGVNDYSGTDARTVIQNAINALGTVGGKIFIKRPVGDNYYTLSSPLDLTGKRAIVIEGETASRYGGTFNYRGTVLTLGNNVNDSMIKITAGSPNGDYVVIKNIVLYGTKVSQTAGNGIDIRTALNIYIENVQIEQVKDWGIFLADCEEVFINNVGIFTSGSGIAANANTMTIRDAEISLSNAGRGIYFGAHNNLRIRGGNIYYAEYGVFLENSLGGLIEGLAIHDNQKEGIYVSGAKNMKIVNNDIYNNGKAFTNSFDGIFLENAVDNVVTGNRIYDTAVPKMHRDGIREFGTSDRNLIAFNNVLDNLGTITTLGSGTVVKHNKGYVTENSVLSGTFPIDSTGLKTVTIAHGLNVVPNKQDVALAVVEETNVDNWAYNLLKVDSVDAANVVAKIYVSQASATAGATARLALRAGKP